VNGQPVRQQVLMSGVVVQIGRYAFPLPEEAAEVNPICPYCRTEVGDAEGEPQGLPGCGTPHHADCFAEMAAAPFLDAADAPSDEAKVTVAGTDLMGNVVTRQTATPTPAPVSRPGLSLGAGYTTFPAPSMKRRKLRRNPLRTLGALRSPAAIGDLHGPSASSRPAPYVASAPARWCTTFHRAAEDPGNLRATGNFPGGLGIHNFYAGYIKKATVQLCITVLTCFTGGDQLAVGHQRDLHCYKDADGTEFV